MLAQAMSVRTALLILSVAALSVAALYVVFSYRGYEAMRPPEMNVRETGARKPHHRGDGTFWNHWGANFDKGFLDILRWRFSANPYAEEKKRPVSFPVEAPDFDALEAAGRPYAVWLGHSTVLMKAGGRRVLTDPVFENVNFLIKRKTRLPVDPRALPGIDYVLVSHGHYDHLNTGSLRLLKALFDPVFVTGPGYEEYFSSTIKTGRHVVLDWWETHEDDALRITALPAQHWSKRTPFDTNRMLWSSFMVEGEARLYWAGDTGYFSGFKEIGERLGPFDAALLPIGSFEPRWLMKDNHMNPEEAFEAAKDLRARLIIPIHWGTFDLTDEPLTLPIERLKAAASGEKNPRAVILNHGGSVIF